MQEILNAFCVHAPILSQKQLSGGRIHGTSLLRTAGGDYIAQKLHPTAFPDPERLMRKLVSVTDFLRPQCITLHFYPAKGGGYLHDGWRLMDAIPGVTRSAPDPETVRAAGRAYGAFQAMLCGYELPEPEPFFHDPARYFGLLPQNAADPRVQALLDALNALRPAACALSGMQLPVRMLHNDTKLTNLLFSPETGDPLAVIDLDTVGTGYAAYDFGDALRSLHGHSTEPSPVWITAFSESFLEGASHLTDAERASLPFGAVAVTAELAARYLADHLTGDRYFRNPDSLSRAEQLTALAKGLCLCYNIDIPL